MWWTAGNKLEVLLSVQFVRKLRRCCIAPAKYWWFLEKLLRLGKIAEWTRNHCLKVSCCKLDIMLVEKLRCSKGGQMWMILHHAATKFHLAKILKYFSFIVWTTVSISYFSRCLLWQNRWKP